MLIDQGQIIISAVIPVSGIMLTNKYFSILTNWIISGLQAVGIKGMERAGSSDLALAGRKISGSSIYTSKDFVYYSASLLVELDAEIMEKYLKFPPRELEYRKGRGHRDFLLGLNEISNYRSAGELADALKQVLNDGSLSYALLDND